MIKRFVFGLLLVATTALADNKLFTYTYEPETEPKGDWELEQSVITRLMRNAKVGQSDYMRLQFSTEVEYGFTDRYTASLRINDEYERYTDPASGVTAGNNRWTGVSMENRYLLLDPVDNPIGLTLYLEPTYDGQNFELEQKIIIGQRHGKWKWAVNLSHATEWEDEFREMEGELELSGGLAYELTHRWAIGIEVRDHNELPEYEQWENTALFLGPVISYHRQNWWAALSVMPQVFGHNFTGDPDGDKSFELEGHERLNIRLLVGISF